MENAETAVRNWLEGMGRIHASGSATPETSFYGQFEILLNALGQGLEPKARCIGQLASQGAGHPDFGMFSATQLPKGGKVAAAKGANGPIPDRGVVEVKSLGEDIEAVASRAQTRKYLERYQLVLVTNYREFRLLIGKDGTDRPGDCERFVLADDEHTFWQMAAHPRRRLTRTKAVQLGEFLQRAMLRAAPLARPEDVAWFLASYAREALTILEGKQEERLTPLRKALEQALGTRFEGEKGMRFFRSTLVQTLFYGLFSAWSLWARNGGCGRFDWRTASFTLTVPMVRALFEEIAKPSRLERLHLDGVTDRTGEVLNRIDPEAFLKRFDSGEAIQHFYEPFLAAFDPALRKEMGVWYTPPEIVRYMVERVDRVLRSELGIAEGLADENVFVLDPCCGTGAYLVEVLRKIRATLRHNRGDDALIAHDVRKAACNRVFGFEIMPAPYVIAHWQVGNLLSELRAPIAPRSGNDNRAAIYLTNALTGWDPPSGAKAKLLFPELEEERDQAERVKRKVPILVVIGNPPYNAFAGTSPEEESGLVEPYKEGLRDQWKIRSFNLDDLYVRFFRVAERRIGKTGRGLICYISSHSYVGDQSFVVMRDSLLRQFDRLWIDSLNGDSRETGKRTPGGAPDPSIFSTSSNPAGIRVGTAVGTFLKRGKFAGRASVAHRDLWGSTKRRQLLDSLDAPDFDAQYELANPQPWNRLSFRPSNVPASYLAWPTLPELAQIEPFNGLSEGRGGALIDIDRDALARRMKLYFDRSADWEVLAERAPSLTKSASDHKTPEQTRKAAHKNDLVYEDAHLVRYLIRPFDVRYAYQTNFSSLWNRARPTLWAQYAVGNEFVTTRSTGVADREGIPTMFTRCLGDQDAQKGHSKYIPFLNRIPAKGMDPPRTSANLSSHARDWLKALALPDPDKDFQVAALPWQHAMAITCSPAYLKANAAGLKIDWPRIPLPGTRRLLERSGTLGGR